MITLTTLHQEMPELTWQVFKVLHILLTAVALITNCLSLIVVYGLVNKLTRPLQLLSSLAFANMLAPWAVITVYFQHTSCQEEIHTALLIMAHNTAALTILTYTLSQYIATFKPLAFERIVTAKRVWFTIASIWVLSVVFAHINFIVALAQNAHETFCTQVFNNTHISLTVAMTICCVTTLTCIVLYARIFTFLRPLGSISRQENQAFPLKSTHGVKTGIILTTFYFFSWLPYLVSAFEHLKVHDTAKGQLTVSVLFCTMILILINCIADPIIYGLRMENVTLGYARMYQNCRSWLSQGWTRIRNHNENEEQPSSPLSPIESIC